MNMYKLQKFVFRLLCLLVGASFDDWESWMIYYSFVTNVPEEYPNPVVRYFHWWHTGFKYLFK